MPCARDRGAAAGEDVTMATESPNTDGSSSLRDMSATDWARFGVQQIAYIRPVLVNGVEAIAIHAADGTPIGAAPNAKLAFAAIVQHEMAPAQLH
jgi:hypothetical protein